MSATDPRTDEAIYAAAVTDTIFTRLQDQNSITIDRVSDDVLALRFFDGVILHVSVARADAVDTRVQQLTALAEAARELIYHGGGDARWAKLQAVLAEVDASPKEEA